MSTDPGMAAALLGLTFSVVALIVAIGPEGRRRERDHWRDLADRDRRREARR